MKMVMIELMSGMMPYMMPLVYIGSALLVLGLIAAFIAFFPRSSGGLARLSAFGLIVLGIFFLASQGAGMMLGANPSVNFGDPTNYEFILYPFWMIGGAMLAVGILIKLINSAAQWRTR